MTHWIKFATQIIIYVYRYVSRDVSFSYWMTSLLTSLISCSAPRMQIATQLHLFATWIQISVLDAQESKFLIWYSESADAMPDLFDDSQHCLMLCSSDCTSPGLPACDLQAVPVPTCVPCLQNTDCSQSTPVCLNKKCVACVRNEDCSSPNPVCDTSTNQCVPGCVTNQNCNNPSKPYCDTSSFSCVECTLGSQCPDVCDPSTNTCVECFESDQCQGSSTNFAVNCDNNVCKSCVPSSLSTTACPDSCSQCPRETPVCKEIGPSEYRCVECSTNDICNNNEECKGCVCDTPGLIREASFNVVQASVFTPSDSKECTNDAVLTAAFNQFGCEGRDAEKPYDVRVIRGTFLPTETYWFYYQSNNIPDEFTITLGKCDSLLTYDSHGSGAVLGKYVTKGDSSAGCPKRNGGGVRGNNPAGSSPCCPVSALNPSCQGNAPGACGISPAYLSFSPPRVVQDLFITVYGPCDSTGWAWILCDDATKSFCQPWAAFPVFRAARKCMFRLFFLFLRWEDWSFPWDGSHFCGSSIELKDWLGTRVVESSHNPTISGIIY